MRGHGKPSVHAWKCSRSWVNRQPTSPRLSSSASLPDKGVFYAPQGLSMATDMARRKECPESFRGPGGVHSERSTTPMSERDQLCGSAYPTFGHSLAQAQSKCIVLGAENHQRADLTSPNANPCVWRAHAMLPGWVRKDTMSWHSHQTPSEPAHGSTTETRVRGGPCRESPGFPLQGCCSRGRFL